MSSSWTAFTTCWPGLRLFDSVLAHDPGADPVHQGPGHADVDVGLEQRRADLAQGLVDVGVAEPAPAAEAAEDPLEAVGQGVEHAERSGYRSDATIPSRGGRPLCVGPDPIPQAQAGRPSDTMGRVPPPGEHRAVTPFDGRW